MGWVQLGAEPACWARETVQSPVLGHNGSKVPREIQKAVAGTAMHRAGLALRQAWADCWEVAAAVHMQ